MGNVDINAGCGRETSDVMLCKRVGILWYEGDVGVTFPNTGVGEGISDMGMFGVNMFSTIRGERGETEGVTGRAWAGERNMWLGDEEDGGWGTEQELGREDSQSVKTWTVGYCEEN